MWHSLPVWEQTPKLQVPGSLFSAFKTFPSNILHAAIACFLFLSQFGPLQQFVWVSETKPLVVNEGCFWCKPCKYRYFMQASSKIRCKSPSQKSDIDGKNKCIKRDCPVTSNVKHSIPVQQQNVLMNCPQAGQQRPLCLFWVKVLAKHLKCEYKIVVLLLCQQISLLCVVWYSFSNVTLCLLLVRNATMPRLRIFLSYFYRPCNK